MEVKNFIVTTNKNTAQTLLQRGYRLFQNRDGKWTFLNDNRLMFSDLESAVLTNKLFI